MTLHSDLVELSCSLPISQISGPYLLVVSISIYKPKECVQNFIQILSTYTPTRGTAQPTAKRQDRTDRDKILMYLGWRQIILLDFCNTIVVNQIKLLCSVRFFFFCSKCVLCYNINYSIILQLGPKVIRTYPLTHTQFK